MIAHLTTVHKRNDMRIQFREVATVAGIGKCCLIVADGLGEEALKGYEIRDLGLPKGGRLGRAVLGSWRAFHFIQRLKPGLVHFHDPELIPLAILLSLMGYRVIYDVHEDVPRQIMGKYWLPVVIRRPVSWLMSALEWLGSRLFTAIITATPKIAERFPSEKTVVVQNFPALSELLAPVATPYSQRPPHFAYIGSITRIRGVEEMIRALAALPAGQDARLQMAGDFSPQELRQEMEALPGWKHVNFLDWIDRKRAAELLGSVRAGLVLFHPAPNHIDAQPNKLFEYMAAGLPVIASDFPLWREIIEGNGLLVDPLNPDAITTAMKWVLEHPREAAAMGQRGRKAVETWYNWDKEKKELLELYSGLLK